MAPARRAWSMGRALWAKYLRDEAMDTAGALTFYTFLAAFPFLLFVVTVASRQLTPELVQGLLAELARVAPAAVTALVGDRLRSLQENAGPGLLTLSLAGAVWSSVTAIVALTAALDRAYEVRETRTFWRVHGLALVVTLVFAAVVLASALLTVAWPLVANWLGGPLRDVMEWLRVPVAGLLVMLLFAAMYRWLPNVRPRRQRVFPGAVLGVSLWLLGSWGFSAWVQFVGTYEIIYGALGGVAILLLWMWLTGQAIIIGAELNLLLERSRAARLQAASRRPNDRATEGPTAPRLPPRRSEELSARDRP